MKPIKLTVNAFICYADEQIIDFTKLGETGLYLITGQTGAGKTTIFDAISYALYGEASGEARNKSEKLRSQFVDNKARTVVDFDFLSSGKKYNIRRELKPQINRDTKEITKINESVVLTLNDGTALDRDREVKVKIEEIVGLNKDQFAQIVMIAQNDFLRFLQSGTEKRTDILRRIFNTGHIKWFQERLKAEKKKADEAIQLVKRDFESRGVNPYERDTIFAEWKKQIIDGEAQQKELDEKIAAFSGDEKKIAASLALAEGIAKLFAELEAARKSEIEHIERKSEIDSLCAKKNRGEVALHSIKPTADNSHIAQNYYNEATKNLTSAMAQLETSNKALQEANETLASLTSVETAEAECITIEKKWAEASERVEKLNALVEQSNAIAEQEAILIEAQSAVESLQAEFNTADAEYKALYERFIRSQAGILARELKENVACPVCGSTTHPKPAMLSDDSINESELDKLQKTANEAKKNLENKASMCTSLIATIKTLKDAFIKDLRKVVKDITAETAAEKLTIAVGKAKDEEKELEANKNVKKNALDKLKADFVAATAKKSDSETAVAAAVSTVAVRKERAEQTKKELNDVVKKFEALLAKHNFADETDYATALLTETQLAELTKTITDHDDLGKQIQRDIKRLEGETKGKQQLDIEAIKAQEVEIKTKIIEHNAQRDILIEHVGKLKDDLKTLTKSAKEFVSAEKNLAAIKGLSDAANGKLDFETYAQVAYFERVLKAANLRLRAMSQNRYVLVRKTDAGDKRQKMGLEIDVLDAHTGKPRGVDSLSGGESFMASLSLALGLSDVVQQSAGGVHLDAMFIDEGFGTLDAEVLDLSIKTLSDMAGNNRIIGIISHVSELRERIDKRIDVSKTPTGSKIAIVG
jgi:exonuclease SbcC